MGPPLSRDISATGPAEIPPRSSSSCPPRSRGKAPQFLPTAKHRCIATFSVLATVFLFATCAEAQQTADEYQVKAAYLFNFAKMAQWPEQVLPQDSVLIFGVYGGDEGFVNILRITFSGKKINGHPIEIYHLHSPSELKFCHLVFFRASEKNVRTVIEHSDSATVLLVGEDNDFLNQGGMINLALVNGRITYQVNSAALERTHVSYGTAAPAQANASAQTNAGSEAPSVPTESSRSVKSRVHPEYPDLALKMGLKGTVQLKVVVKADGTVRGVQVMGGHPVLAEAALQAVMRWRFEPSDKETTEVVKISFGE